MIPRLGIGLPYFGSLIPEVYRSGAVDFVEITPETLCRQRREGTTTHLDLVPTRFHDCREAVGSLPIVIHGVELSIGSAARWNDAYIELLDRFQSLWPFLWHSEHLGFQTIPGDDGSTLETGVPLPMPATEESVDLVAARSASMLRRFGVPFLLENAVHYIDPLPFDASIADEFGLMRAIMERSGCFQLLDLHNVYCNAVNHNFDPFAAIDRVPLDRVVEIHVAGGTWQDGFWVDAHNGRTPERVWELLEYTLPRAPNVAAIVFELLEEHVASVGVDLIVDELDTARSIWRKRAVAA